MVATPVLHAYNLALLSESYYGSIQNAGTCPEGPAVYAQKVPRTCHGFEAALLLLHSGIMYEIMLAK
jgi:hypothetical protein